MSGRTILVTGANCGIGFETAKQLCEGGNDVILCCRDETKGQAAVDKIKEANPNALVSLMQLDLASLESINNFVTKFHESGKKLHCLINNAGMALAFNDKTRKFTKDGFEMTIGVNHLGPFLLTNLLLDDLKSCAADPEADVRVVNVVSQLHDPVHVRQMRKEVNTIDATDLNYDKEGRVFNGLQAYKDSKLCQVLFTQELAERLADTTIAVNCVCPGWVPETDLSRQSSSILRFATRYIVHRGLRFLKKTRTIPDGARGVVQLATAEEYKGVRGKFVASDVEAEASEETKVENIRTDVWTQSAGMVRLPGYDVVEMPERPEPPPLKVEKVKKEKVAKEEKPKKEKTPKAEKPKKEKKEKKEKKSKTDEEKTDVEEVKTENGVAEGEKKEEVKEETAEEPKMAEVEPEDKVVATPVIEQQAEIVA